MSSDRIELAVKKRERSEALIAEGLQPIDVMKKVEEEFGSGISGTTVYAQFHKFHGTKPHPTRGGRRKKSKQKAARKLKTELIVPKPKTRAIEVELPPATSSPTVDVLLTALLRAMRTEGVDSVMIRADGRATVYHVVSRELQIGG